MKHKGGDKDRYQLFVYRAGDYGVTKESIEEAVQDGAIYKFDISKEGLQDVLSIVAVMGECQCADKSAFGLLTKVEGEYCLVNEELI